MLRTCLRVLGFVLSECADSFRLCALVTPLADAPDDVSDYNFVANNTQYIVEQDGVCTMPGSAHNFNRAHGPSAIMVPDTAVWNATTEVDGELLDVFTETTPRRHTTYTVSRSSGLLVTENQTEALGPSSTTRYSDFNVQPASITLPAACNGVATAFAATTPAHQPVIEIDWTAHPNKLGCGLGCVDGNCCSAWDRTCCAYKCCNAMKYKGQCC